MKKIVFILLSALVVFVVIFFVGSTLFEKSPSTEPFLDSSTTPLPTSSFKSSTVAWNGITYAYEYFEVTEISKLRLIANFTEKKSSEELLQKNNCIAAINGGYYVTNNKPLGLFSNQSINTPAIESALVNGYIAVTTKPTVSFDLPDHPKIALQTGPMLLSDGKTLKLAIKNDEYARRMIAGISSKGTLVLMTVFVPETKVQGPKLGDLPDVIGKINTRLADTFVSAINLDGGNASMFKNSAIYISEVSSVGSMFCLQ